jgi:hypothetical protein
MALVVTSASPVIATAVDVGKEMVERRKALAIGDGGVGTITTAPTTTAAMTIATATGRQLLAKGIRVG